MLPMFLSKAKLGYLKDLSFTQPIAVDGPDFIGSVMMPKALEPLQVVYPDSSWWVVMDVSDSNQSKIEVDGPVVLSFDLPTVHERVTGKYHSATATFEKVMVITQWSDIPVKLPITVQELIDLDSTTEVEFYTFLRDRCKPNRVQREKVIAQLKYLAYKGPFL